MKSAVLLLVTWIYAGSITLNCALAAAPSTNQTVNQTVDDAEAAKFESQAREVMQHIQSKFFDAPSGLYTESTKNNNAAYMWSNGILLPAMLGAARYDPDTYLPMADHFFKSLNAYWDFKQTMPGYEPSPTHGTGHDKYYDDNQWMVLALTEAYQMTHDQKYLDRAKQVQIFSLSGWDDKAGGGIWWHEAHKDGTKNTCSNAPAAVGCMRLARFLPPDQAKASITMGQKITAWTTDEFQLPGGLFMDCLVVNTGHKRYGKLTYNTALMIRAYLDLFRWTHESHFLDQAKTASAASDWFIDPTTLAYRDAVKWSHLMVEADLEMYRTTHEPYLMKRAKDTANYTYKAWKAAPSSELIDNAAVARLLWLMADSQSGTGQKFWTEFDRVSN